VETIWVTALIQTGVTGILAYHFLIGLPALLERIAKDQQVERQFWADQAQRDRDEFARRAENIAIELRRLTAEREGTLPNRPAGH
jgi:hypothetical protein